MNDTNIETASLERDKVVTSKMSDNEQFNGMIQVLVDGYLRRKKQNTMPSLLKAEGLEDKPGLIYGYHLEFVQMLIQEELGILGIDLPTEVKKSGEEFQVGKLSALEKKYLTNKINNLIGIVIEVNDRIVKKQNKQ